MEIQGQLSAEINIEIFNIAKPGDRTARQLPGDAKLLIWTNTYQMHGEPVRHSVFHAGAAVIHRVPCTRGRAG